MLSIFPGILAIVAFTIAFFGSERTWKWRRPLKDYEVSKLRTHSASIRTHFQTFLQNVWRTTCKFLSQSFSRDEFYGIGGQDMDICKVKSSASHVDAKTNVTYIHTVQSISRATAQDSIHDGLLRALTHHKASKSMKSTLSRKLKPSQLPSPRADTFMQAA
uniref:AlNc14C137G7118 protein n=1 Tax=Albugo laibachii Nc14 TaxID=890382 RepID=F0WKS8_9STRA|nr:AlNc14C137G7118 [Albugo laibachii Nc14]|eukprot:CCA21885.1 AlNc14C137G7118 [Albugo laibachii Nc14]